MSSYVVETQNLRRVEGQDICLVETQYMWSVESYCLTCALLRANTYKGGMSELSAQHTSCVSIKEIYWLSTWRTCCVSTMWCWVLTRSSDERLDFVLRYSLVGTNKRLYRCKIVLFLNCCIVFVHSERTRENK